MNNYRFSWYLYDTFSLQKSMHASTAGKVPWVQQHRTQGVNFVSGLPPCKMRCNDTRLPKKLAIILRSSTTNLDIDFRVKDRNYLKILKSRRFQNSFSEFYHRCFKNQTTETWSYRKIINIIFKMSKKITKHKRGLVKWYTNLKLI